MCWLALGQHTLSLPPFLCYGAWHVSFGLFGEGQASAPLAIGWEMSSEQLLGPRHSGISAIGKGRV